MRTFNDLGSTGHMSASTVFTDSAETACLETTIGEGETSCSDQTVRFQLSSQVGLVR